MKNTSKLVFGVLVGLFMGMALKDSVAQIIGNVANGVLNENAMRVIIADKKINYESKEFALGVVVNYDVKAGQAAFDAATLPRAHNIVIRTNATLTIRFNSPTADPITLTATEGQMSWTHIEVTNIYITTTGAATIKILLS